MIETATTVEVRDPPVPQRHQEVGDQPGDALAGRLETLDWPALRFDPEAAAIDYSFRYFQQVEGDFALPAGFQPTRVTVRLDPASGPDVAQSFDWQDLL